MARTLRGANSGAGHNSGERAIDRDALKRYVSRVANVMEQQKELARAVVEICSEADEAGVATKREIRRRAKESLMDPAVLRAQLDRDEELRLALGWLAETPLGINAISRAAQ